MGGVQGEGERLLRHRPIFLLGFMGSGKSTVGPLLARALGRPFVDLDKVIEEETGKTIEAIFRDEGETRFREYESLFLKKVGSGEVVVATGGGVVIREENWKVLEKGVTVALVASPEELEKRLAGSVGRPLLEGDRDWRELLKDREPLYRRASLIVETTGLTPLEVVEVILKGLEDEGEGSGR